MSVLLDAGIAIIVIIIVAIFFIIYNGLVVLSNNIKKAWANIDVLLQQRHDELGKLIDTVSGYMKYEQGLQTQVTQLRTAWMQTPADVQSKIDNSNQISQALKSIFATAENYPNLKADEGFMQLQQRISGIETSIADRREFYNDTVNTYNIRIKQVPYNMVAGMVHYQQQPLYNPPEEEKQDVKIDFNQ